LATPETARRAEKAKATPRRLTRLSERLMQLARDGGARRLPLSDAADCTGTAPVP
jgi:hypothetical protein